MNNVSLIGRLTKDAELMYTTGGAGYCKFTLAVNDRRKQGEEWVDYAHFIDCTMWGGRAEKLTQYLTKGAMIGVSGSLDQQRWEKDGQKRSKLEVKVFDVTLTGKGGGGGAANDAIPF